MSAETFPTHLPQGEINARTETSAEKDTRKPSTLAEAMRRVADVLETRAINNAHEDALKEYSERDHAGYMDHLAELSTTQAGGDTVAMEQQQTFAQDRLNRENRKADRAEKLEHAKERVVGFGKSALNFLRKTKRIAAKATITGFGIGLVGGKAAAQGVKKGADTVKEGVQSKAAEVKWRVDSARENRALRREQAQELKAFDQKVKIDKANEAQWRHANAIEDEILAGRHAEQTEEFEKKEALAKKQRELLDQAELRKAAKIDRKFEAKIRRKVMKERAQAAIARRIERLKAVKDSGIEKVEKAREVTKQRARLIGHSVMTTLAFANEAGEEAIASFKQKQQARREFESSIPTANSTEELTGAKK